jgi:HEXXH motif-containing protein
VLDSATLDGLSCPQIGLDSSFLDALLCGHADEVLRTFLDKHADVLQKDAPDLVDFLRDGAIDELAAKNVWDISFGDLHAALLDEPGCPVTVAVRVGIHLAALGRAGAWSARLASPTRFRVGRWVLPPMERMTVESLSSGFTVHDSDSGEAYAFGNCRQLDAATASRAAGLHHVASDSLSFDLLNASALSTGALRRLLQADAYSFDNGSLGRIETWSPVCREAMEIIETVAPEYAPWIGRVVTDLVPLEGKPGLFNSGSERFSPGVVCLSDHDFAWMTAEILVHEATHQYLHIASRLGPLDDGSDPELHFSPFRGKDRPIFFIVAAYHAFANVLLFYRSARSKGYRPDTPAAFQMLADREGVLARQLAVIEPTLRSNSTLTPLGQSLWRPLHDQLRACA